MNIYIFICVLQKQIIELICEIACIQLVFMIPVVAQSAEVESQIDTIDWKTSQSATWLSQRLKSACGHIFVRLICVYVSIFTQWYKCIYRYIVIHTNLEASEAIGLKNIWSIPTTRSLDSYMNSYTRLTFLCIRRSHAKRPWGMEWLYESNSQPERQIDQCTTLNDDWHKQPL